MVWLRSMIQHRRTSGLPVLPLRIVLRPLFLWRRELELLDDRIVSPLARIGTLDLLNEVGRRHTVALFVEPDIAGYPGVGSEGLHRVGHLLARWLAVGCLRSLGDGGHADAGCIIRLGRIRRRGGVVLGLVVLAHLRRGWELAWRARGGPVAEGRGS